MFSFLEYRSLWETSSSTASKRAVVENMNYGVSGGWQQHVRSGHLSGDRREIRVFLLPACWSQRYCVWYGCGFVVRLQGPVNSDPHFRKYKARNSFFFFFLRLEVSDWVFCLTSWVSCCLDVLKWLICNIQNLAFTSCSWEGQEHCSSIDIFWNSLSSDSVPPGQSVL